jgi:Sec-independent protein secretion pathway component TatC
MTDNNSKDLVLGLCVMAIITFLLGIIIGVVALLIWTMIVYFTQDKKVTTELIVGEVVGLIIGAVLAMGVGLLL